MEAEQAKQAHGNADVSSTGLVCTNDGFVSMVQEGAEVTWAGLAIVKELAIGLVPDNFKKAINFGWEGLMGIGNWTGFVFASIYYLAKEGDFGADMCEFFGYGYFLIDELYILVDFMSKGENDDSSGGINIASLATASAKNSALEEAMAGIAPAIAQE